MTRKSFHISKFKPSIFQGAFDFEAVSNKRAHALAVEYPAERIAFTLLIALLGILICAYFYFVIGSVFNVIAEKQADSSSANMQGSIASLEQQYFALSQALTPQAATDMGLAPVQNTQYVFRPGNAAAIPSPIREI